MKALRKLFGRTTAAPRPTARPGREALEDRTALSTVACIPNGGGLYAIRGLDRGLYRYTPASYGPGSWSGEFANNVSKVAVGADGTLDYATTDGSVYQMTPVWGLPYSTPLKLTQGQIGELAAGPGGQVYVTYGANQELWRHDMWGSWHDLHDSNITDISVSNTGTLFKIYNDNYGFGGTLHYADSNDDSWSDHLLVGIDANGWGVLSVAATTGQSCYYTKAFSPLGWGLTSVLYRTGWTDPIDYNYSNYVFNGFSQVSADPFTLNYAYIDAPGGAFGNLTYNGQNLGFGFWTY